MLRWPLHKKGIAQSTLSLGNAKHEPKPYDLIGKNSRVKKEPRAYINITLQVEEAEKERSPQKDCAS